MIKHIKCDIFKSNAEVICHQVNCQGVVDSGIAKQVKENYPKVFELYKLLCEKYHKEGRTLLGKVQAPDIDGFRCIANLFAQKNYGYDGKGYTDYDALKKCLVHIKNVFQKKVIAFPYLMGCHKDGDWNRVYSIIQDIFSGDDCKVLICEYNNDENIIKFGYGDICVGADACGRAMIFQRFKSPINCGDTVNLESVELIGKEIVIKINAKDYREFNELLLKVETKKLDKFVFKDYIFDFTNYNEKSIEVCKEKSNEAMRLYLLALAA